MSTLAPPGLRDIDRQARLASAPAARAIDVHMCRALQLATQSIGLSDPNPRVGCVITSYDGRVIGEGYTQPAGDAHAEVMALRDAAALGESVVGATVYVTLEPCAHHGRTPPCCDALVKAGVGRVVVALGDPHPEVAGRGLARLRQAGVDVIELPAGILRNEAHELNIGFFSRMQRGRPWVRLKTALSLDGKISLLNGESQWITGELARNDGHVWRKRSGAVLTGVGTVLSDDPRMNVRAVATARQPLRVILDSRLRTPVDAAILRAPGKALIYAAQPDADRQEALQEAGAVVAFAAGDDGHVSLRATLEDLARRGINEVHVEAGRRLNEAFVRRGLVDEFVFYLAPQLLGTGHDFASLGPFSRLAEGVRLEIRHVDMVGQDLRIVARCQSCEPVSTVENEMLADIDS